MAKREIMLISGSDSFIVRGLKSKLEGLKLRVTQIRADYNEVMQNKENVDLFVYYMGDEVTDAVDLLNYLKEICTEEDMKLILIGSRTEYDIAMKFFPSERLLRWFERPLEMEPFLKEAASYMSLSEAKFAQKNILIVDDDVTYLRTIREWLKEEYKVAMVNSGLQAITWLAKNQADLILLDYEMPVTSGPQVLEMLRSEPNSRNIPVMFLTGKSDRDSIMRVLDLKPTDYLLKSIDKHELVMKLRRFFAAQDHKAGH